MVASSPSLIGSLHIAPDEMIIMSELRSHVPGCSSRRPGAGGEGIAHDDEPVDLLALDGVEQLDRVVLARSSRQTRPPSASAVLAVKLPGPVRERAGRQDGDAAGLASSAARTASRPPSTG